MASACSLYAWLPETPGPGSEALPNRTQGGWAGDCWPPSQFSLLMGAQVEEPPEHHSRRPSLGCDLPEAQEWGVGCLGRPKREPALQVALWAQALQ